MSEYLLFLLSTVSNIKLNIFLSAAWVCKPYLAKPVKKNIKIDKTSIVFKNTQLPATNFLIIKKERIEIIKKEKRRINKIFISTLNLSEKIYFL